MGTTNFLKLKTITGSTPVNVNTGMGTNFERIDEWASTTETKISEDAAALEAFKGSVIDGADEIWATTQDGIPAGAHGVSRLVTQIRTTITQKVAELTEKITANTTKADANAASIEMLNSNLKFWETAEATLASGMTGNVYIKLNRLLNVMHISGVLNIPGGITAGKQFLTFPNIIPAPETEVNIPAIALGRTTSGQSTYFDLIHTPGNTLKRVSPATAYADYTKLCFQCVIPLNYT